MGVLEDIGYKALDFSKRNPTTTKVGLGVGGIGFLGGTGYLGNEFKKGIERESFSGKPDAWAGAQIPFAFGVGGVLQTAISFGTTKLFNLNNPRMSNWKNLGISTGVGFGLAGINAAYLNNEREARLSNHAQGNMKTSVVN